MTVHAMIFFLPREIRVAVPFAARARHLEHFRARASRSLRRTALRPGEWVVFVGGWNDARERDASPVEACVRLVQRHESLVDAH